MPKDPYQYYRVEARDLLEGLNRGTLELEREPASRAPIRELLRLAHTLKGASRVVKQVEIADLAHAVEEVLARFREGDAIPSRGEVDAVLGLLDRISAKLAELDPKPALEESGGRGMEPFDSVRVTVEELDQVIRGVFEAGVQAKAMRQPLATLEHVASLSGLLQDQLSSPRFAELTSTTAGRRLVSLTDEVRRMLAAVKGELVSALEHTEAELAQLRDGVDQLRLLSAGSMFGVLERATRDAAAATGKAATFEASGAEVKLDAHVLRALRDAMLHVVRNAVAHGLEPGSERERKGKSPIGRVSVAFQRHGARVAFLCGDDGRGIDLAAIWEQARRRGLVVDGEAFDPQKTVSLLLRGGLSTRETVTEVAGRGIGLDVVRDTVARLKGDVFLRTEEGRGTTVEIRVPVSLSSAQALFVEAGGARVCVPLNAVQQTLLVPTDSIARGGDSESVVVEGEVLAFASLARLLRLGPRPLRRSSLSMVVVEGGGRRAALGVDRLLGTADVVVRPLPPAVHADPLVVGAALDADGTPRLVLDPARLVIAAAGLSRAPEEEPARQQPRVLIIDDSLTTRMLEQSILESAGYEVELASDGQEALDKARQLRFDLFLVDIEMPGIDGFEFIRLSQEDPRLRGTPSILVSSRTSAEDRRRGEQVGARAYLAKSEFEQGVLLKHIRELVR
jgi:two-component system chemotaxis sensor kinase CheA